MTPAERRRALLGDAVVEEIAARVDAAPAPPEEVIIALRRILAPTPLQAPARPIRRKRPAPVDLPDAA
ncbi:hypothetical protein [Streptomyces sp. SID11385]|uniref:hypothetical protein n=1 Tax=Streptomyces sp. SID11385 TaxID=2706031 RepID=UPI0013CD1A1D|nr:hypothetical protein [Streptomyces sp. SID11385]NEA40922.1 hypothetical protein [Streptomyces sp. SID11385]